MENYDKGIWHDKDLPPYIKGEDPYLDKVLDEIVENLLEMVRNGEFNTKDETTPQNDGNN